MWEHKTEEKSWKKNLDITQTQPTQTSDRLGFPSLLVETTEVLKIFLL